MTYLFCLNKKMQQRQFEKSVWIYPVQLAMFATALRNQGHTIYWDYPESITQRVKIDHVIRSDWDISIPFKDLPAPDRILTDAMNPKWQDNGNFKYKPGTYCLATSGCWYGKCTFCIESKKPQAHIRHYSDLVNELVECKCQGFKEVFDDCGTFPVGQWLRDFCNRKISNAYVRDYPISCNMRIGTNADYRLMKKAGFRMLLYGVESINQKTLNRLNKRTFANDTLSDLRSASKAGLEPHIAVMFGFPWESSHEELETLKFVHHCLRKGYAKTAQASLYAVEGEANIDRGNVAKIYNAAYHPEFWINKLKDIREWEDVRYMFRGIKDALRYKFRRRRK